MFIKLVYLDYHSRVSLEILQWLYTLSFVGSIPLTIQLT